MTNLRTATIRLAHSNPELRPYLLPLLKEASVTYRKEKIDIPTYSGKSESVDAAVYGPWAVHKNLGSNGWSVTFVPSGQSITTRSKTLMDAKAFLETILEREPSLVHANSVDDVLRHKALFMELIRNPPAASGSAKRAPMPVSDKRDIVMGWLKAEGFRSQGTRSGKAGEFFYLPSSDGTPSRAVAVGAREMLLNEYIISSSYGRYDERWGMAESVLLSKVTEDMVKRAAVWAKKAPSRKELRERADVQAEKFEAEDADRRELNREESYE